MVFSLTEQVLFTISFLIQKNKYDFNMSTTVLLLFTKGQMKTKTKTFSYVENWNKNLGKTKTTAKNVDVISYNNLKFVEIT